jgi:heme/copper-type cytochrome/quinol oxidase subunit 2
VQKLGLTIVVVTLALAATVLYFASLHPFSPSQGATTIRGVECGSYGSSFTVVATQSGYNDSIGHGVPGKPWPILCVRVGEQVTITFTNGDTVEPHGFAVAGYADAGVTVLPGRSTTMTFYASSPGDFRIYCNVLCAVHPYMQSGVLVVS